MRKLNYLFILSALAIAGCSSGRDIVIEDFESGGFGEWKVEGDAFGGAPASGALSGQQDVEGFEGRYYASSFHGGDDSRGTLTSPEFVIQRDYINFLTAGGRGEDTYIELLVDGETVCKSRPVAETEHFRWVSWDVAALCGKTGVIRIVDNQGGGWGHIMADHFVMSDSGKNVYVNGYEMSFDIDSNYLLIPVENGDPKAWMWLRIDGRNVGVPVSIRVAQTRTDYWVPIDVSAFKGRRLSLVFDLANRSAAGYSQIRQSNEFGYEFNEKYRPVYHFSPPFGWTNDPNGLVYHDGQYHLFYQHNPYGTMWGNMNWGHAVSEDLLFWKNLPVAISPDSLGSIFSGSAVIDRWNTAGFGHDAMIAVFTSAGRMQRQSIAYSRDNGRTFTKYGGNPVLSDPSISDFRDPKVIWYEKGRKWVMSLATAHTISFYESKDLKQWRKTGEFGEKVGSHGGIWECPDLFPLTYNGLEKWVLLVSINPGGPNGGNATQYFIGDFDGSRFRPDDLPYPLWLDYGRDNYAGVTWNDAPDGRRLFIGWMSNWDYANYVPTLNFRNAMTLVRELRLIHNGQHLVVGSYPVAAAALGNSGSASKSFTVDGSHRISPLTEENAGAYVVTIEVAPRSAGRFGFKLMNSFGETLCFDFDLRGGELLVDRTNSGKSDFSSSFASVMRAPLVKRDNYRIDLYVDKASTELFINGGELVSTNIVFPEDPYDIMEFESDGIMEVTDMKVGNIR